MCLDCGCQIYLAGEKKNVFCIINVSLPSICLGTMSVILPCSRGFVTLPGVLGDQKVRRALLFSDCTPASINTAAVAYTSSSAHSCDLLRHTRHGYPTYRGVLKLWILLHLVDTSRSLLSYQKTCGGGGEEHRSFSMCMCVCVCGIRC